MNSLSEKLMIYNTELTLAKKNLDLLKNSVIFKNIRNKFSEFEEKLDRNTFNFSSINNNSEKEVINASQSTQGFEQNDVFLSVESEYSNDKDDNISNFNENPDLEEIKLKLVTNPNINMSNEIDKLEMLKYQKRVHERKQRKAKAKARALSEKHRQNNRKSRTSSKSIQKRNALEWLIGTIKQLFKK